MVHYPNATVSIALWSTSKNDEGTRISEYNYTNPVETFRADVQPNTLTKEQIELYGIDTKNAHTKKCFFDSASYMQAGNRAMVVYDDGTTEYYDICPMNKWRIHCEALLIPVENE